jgi:hypothetical protein
MLSLEELFCSVDDLCKIFEPLWHKQRLSDGSNIANEMPNYP